MRRSEKFCVINEDLVLDSLKKSIVEKDEETKKNQAFFDKDTIENDNIFRLTFSFKSLYLISNLQGFINLRELILDNNNITKIENINHLTNLERLDLSFNKIASITDGSFKHLTKLSNLSFYCNQLTMLENLEELTNLKMLNVGKNKIEEKKNIKFLRQFKKLKCLTLTDNPIANDRNYKNNVLEYLSGLTFLDYRLVLKKDVEEARGRSDNIKSLEDEEKEERKRDEKRKEDEEKEGQLKLAGIERINTLFQEIFEKCPKDLEEFLFFTRNIIDDYQKKFNEVVKKFISVMFENRKAKLNEIEELEVVINMEKNKNMHNSRKMIKDFEKRKKKVKVMLEKLNNEQEGLESITDLEKRARILCNKLTEIEVNQSEVFIDIIDEFIENYKQLDNSELIQSYFKEIKKIDSKFSDKYKNQILFVNQIKDEKHKDSEKKKHIESVRHLLEDKDQLLSTLMRATESRMGVINQREEMYLENEKKSMENKVHHIKVREHDRNRLRVFEIWSYLDRIVGGKENKEQPEIMTMRTQFINRINDL